MTARVRLLALLACTLPVTASAQITYTRAERLLPWNTTQLVSGDQVNATWLLDAAAASKLPK